MDTFFATTVLQGTPETVRLEEIIQSEHLIDVIEAYLAADVLQKTPETVRLEEIIHSRMGEIQSNTTMLKKIADSDFAHLESFVQLGLSMKIITCFLVKSQRNDVFDGIMASSLREAFLTELPGNLTFCTTHALDSALDAGVVPLGRDMFMSSYHGFDDKLSKFIIHGGNLNSEPTIEDIFGSVLEGAIASAKPGFAMHLISLGARGNKKCLKLAIRQKDLDLCNALVNQGIKLTKVMEEIIRTQWPEELADKFTTKA